MLNPNLTVFYVKDTAKSAVFYEKLFGLKPSGDSPTFVPFVFPNGWTFALWSTSSKDFVSEGKGHRSELAFTVSTEEEIRRMREDWKNLGIAIEQDLFEAKFGLTFVALDPDGHRIRVCLPCLPD